MEFAHNASATKKRKFNPAHEEAFLVIETPVGSMCLLCQSVFSDNRRSNFKRHYDKFHSDFEEAYPFNSPFRSEKVNLLKSNARKFNTVQQNQGAIVNSDLDASTIISYRVTQLLVTSGKPFTDGELIKNAFNILSEELFADTDEKSKLQDSIKNISLSPRTVVRRLESMNANLEEQLNEDIKRCDYYSLQLDESNDVNESANQINVFIRLVFQDMKVKEELFDTISVKKINNDEDDATLDVYTCLKNSLVRHGVPLEKLAAITTEGYKAIKVEKKSDFISFCREDPEFPTFASFRCLIRQVYLSANDLRMDHVVNVVIKIIHLIKSKPQQQKLFVKLLQEASELKSSDVSIGDAKWLNLGKLLEKFLELLPQIKEFLKDKNDISEQLSDPKWLLDLNFLIDLTNELNVLNLSLQGKNHEVWRLLTYVDTFDYKLNLWIDHFKQNKIFTASFPNLRKCVLNFKRLTDFPAENFVKYLEIILRNFNTRFDDWINVRSFKNFSSNMLDIDKIDLQQITQSLQNFDPSIDGIRLTNEILNLQTDVNIRSRVNINNDLKIWDLLKEREYPILLSMYKRMLSIFGTTYLCESSFSTMKHIKSRYRTQITHEHLRKVMRICASSYQPDIKKLVEQSQCHPSRK